MDGPPSAAGAKTPFRGPQRISQLLAKDRGNPLPFQRFPFFFSHVASMRSSTKRMMLGTA